MLAPRKKLWSTPNSAVEHLLKWMPLQEGDCVCDVGCGNGQILLTWAECHFSSGAAPPSSSETSSSDVGFIGIDIDSDRINECEQRLSEMKKDGRIPEHANVTFHVGNALQAPELYQQANKFYLYLIPRGLKLLLPYLRQHQQLHKLEKLCVASYMAKLPGEVPKDRALLSVEHQPEAAWPLYYHELSS